MKKNILLTGGAGFVGSSLALYVQKRWKGCRVICFDNLIRKGSSLNVQRLNDNGIQFIRGDIRDKIDGRVQGDLAAADFQACRVS